ncbi:MAG: CAP domain-containing protein [Candidatus Peregrinibacteria bacterium]|nr:CAP domain-containing protein [Candidatus Peregrinibacteria bacterium]
MKRLLPCAALLVSSLLWAPDAHAALIKPVTRAEAAMVLLLSRVPYVPEVENDGSFHDVQPGTWYEKYMLTAYKYGLLNPDSHGNLRPEQPVTRAEFLKMLTYTFGLPQNLQHSYNDIPRDAWYAPYAGTAEKYRIFGDLNIRKLRPWSLLSHAQAAQAIQNFLAMEEHSGPTEDERQRAIEQVQRKLAIYQKISHTEEAVTLLNKRYLQPAFVEPPKPAQEPLVALPETITPTVPITIPIEVLPSIATLRDEIIRLVNQVRRDADLPPLRYNTSLENSAQVYAEDMAGRGYFGHVTPEGVTLRDRIERSDYYRPFFQSNCFCVLHYLLGENIANGHKTAEEVVNAWMKSLSHRKAILHPSFQDIGIGISKGIWVQHFGGIRRE